MMDDVAEVADLGLAKEAQARIKAVLKRHRDTQVVQGATRSATALESIQAALIGQEEVANGGHAMAVAAFIDLLRDPSHKATLFLARNDARAADMDLLARTAPPGMRGIVEARLILGMDRREVLKPLSKFLQKGPNPSGPKDPLKSWLRRNKSEGVED